MIEFYFFFHFKLRKQQLFTNSPPQSFVHQFEKISFLSAFEIKITVISSGYICPANLKVIKIQKTILGSSSLVVSSQKIKTKQERYENRSMTAEISLTIHRIHKVREIKNISL